MIRSCVFNNILTQSIALSLVRILCHYFLNQFTFRYTLRIRICNHFIGRHRLTKVCRFLLPGIIHCFRSVLLLCGLFFCFLRGLFLFFLRELFLLREFFLSFLCELFFLCEFFLPFRLLRCCYFPGSVFSSGTRISIFIFI